MRDAVDLTVPLVPPSLNHYKTPYIRRGRIAWHVSREATAYKQAIAHIAAGNTLDPMTDAGRRTIRYSVHVRIVLGKAQRGDVDNFAKLVLDGLQDAGVIHSDARVKICHLVVDDKDRSNPRTEISVRVLPAERKEA